MCFSHSAEDMQRVLLVAARARKGVPAMRHAGAGSSLHIHVRNLSGLSLIGGSGDGEASGEAKVVEGSYGFRSFASFRCFCQEYWRSRAALAEAALCARARARLSEQRFALGTGCESVGGQVNDISAGVVCRIRLVA